jgi:hypothetical protein
MPLVIAALGFVGGLCLLDLLLTFGVIRRLREHAEMLASQTPARQAIGLAAGKAPAPFSAVATTGELVSGAARLRLIAFFSTCPICPGRVAPLAEYIRKLRFSPNGVLVVSVGSGSEPQPYLAELASLATICVEPEGGPIADAFEVTGFPCFFLLDADGVVIASGFDPAKLPDPATV